MKSSGTCAMILRSIESLLMEIEIDRIQRADPRSSHFPAHHARLVVSPDDFAATSPFLLMAADWFAPPAGFPDHPHRGMQTVTIVFEGGLEHRDHTGAHGLLGRQAYTDYQSGRLVEPPRRSA